MPKTAASTVIKLSSPDTRESWELPVLFEDEYLLALSKPARLLASTDRFDPQRPNLTSLLHREIERGAPWTKVRPGLSYLRNAHRLDFEISGVFLLAKSKAVLIALANLFGSEKGRQDHVALVQGVPEEDSFAVEARLAPDPSRAGAVRVDPKRGKRARTEVKVRERFAGYALLQCSVRTERSHQISAHLQRKGFPVVGDAAYGGRALFLSRLKSDYRLKPNKTERPLISSAALHAEEFSFDHPVTGELLKIIAPWPKDLTVAVKYLRRYATA